MTFNKKTRLALRLRRCCIPEEDERYFFMETECEKLLKSLRHQSDAKHMHWFVQAIYPPDYQAFISRPMAWEQCNDNLQNGRYDSIGPVSYTHLTLPTKA